MKGSDGGRERATSRLARASTKGRPVKGSDPYQPGGLAADMEPQRRAAR